MKKFDLSILLGLVLTIFLTSIFQNNLTAQNIRNDTLRLHVIANSNSDYDQQTKLLVRDAILSISDEIYFDSSDINTAIQNTNQNMDKINDIVDLTLKKNNSKYTASCSIEKFYFDTTYYDNFTLPQGEYQSLTVKLGEANGKNWWCVLYPSLCLTGADTEYTDKNETEFISSDIEFKFKTVEIYEDIKKFFTNSEIEQYDNI